MKLADLQAMMDGHAHAFRQLSLLGEGSAAFGESFGNWLYSSRGSSATAGWAVSVEELAIGADVDPIELFFELADEFVSTLKEGVD